MLNAKKHKPTKKNRKANAEKGSLFKTMGNVVIKAEDHSKINIKGKNFDTLFLLIYLYIRVNLSLNRS